MGLVTALYKSCTPLLESGVGFDALSFVGSVGGSIYKWRIGLKDGTTWLLYVAGQVTQPELKLEGGHIRGPTGFTGTLQVAKNPSGSASEAKYDSATGAYAVSTTISAAVSGEAGSYAFSFSKQGVADRSLLMFALPHHVQAFDSTTSSAKAGFELQTTTKGVATAVPGRQMDDEPRTAYRHGLRAVDTSKAIHHRTAASSDRSDQQCRC